MLYSREQGAGQPVVLVHGLFGSMENLGTQARLLAKHFRVLSVDLPNHGRSPHSDSMSLALMAKDLKDWLDYHAIERAAFVGHSLGGKVVMELALRYPRYVDRLVVIDIAPVAYLPRHRDVLAAFTAVDVDSLERRADADNIMAVHVKEEAVRSFLLKNLVKTPEGFAWRMNLPVIASSYPELIAANIDPSHSEQYASFKGPVLFIKGGASDYILEEHREAIVSRFPNVSLKIVPNTGHWLHAEKPEHVGGVITRFLQ